MNTKIGEGFDHKQIADIAARVVAELWEAKLRTVAVKHRNMKGVIDAIAKTAGIPRPSETTVRAWAKSKGFPLKRDAVGLFVSQWALEMWLAEVYEPRRAESAPRRRAA